LQRERFEERTMKNTSSPLPDPAREAIAAALRGVLSDGLDLYTQLKVAHWNVKGPQFAALHPLFDQFATDQAANNDDVAERVRTLGHLAVGTSRHVARTSRLADYPQDVTKDLEHVALLADRIGVHLDGMRQAREVAKRDGDEDTFDLLTGMIEQFEKHAWFLHATLGR
jgi:starvation-inducible DNA-binding protein